MTDYSIGQRLKLSDRIRDAVDVRAEAGHKIRMKTEEALVTITPTWENDNLKPGTLMGAVAAGLTTVSDQYLLPLNSDTEIVDTEILDNGDVKYTVNVDSAFFNQGRFKAMMEAGTGATALITDRFDYGNSGTLKERPIRDTNQYEVIVKKSNESATRGPGIIRDAVDSIGE